jgi:hypothetical protein
MSGHDQRRETQHDRGSSDDHATGVDNVVPACHRRGGGSPGFLLGHDLDGLVVTRRRTPTDHRQEQL